MQWYKHRAPEALAQAAIGRHRGLVRCHGKQNRHRNRALPCLLDKIDLSRQREKNDSNESCPRSMTFLVSSSVTRRSNNAICPFTSRTEAATVCAGRNCDNVRSPELRSNATPARFSLRWKSVSNRATSVFPTRGRGDATTVTELRNDI